MFSLRKTTRTTTVVDGKEVETVVDSGLTASPRPDTGKALKGERGRIEEWAQAEADGRYSFNYLDVGNYGKDRWASKGYLTADELDAAIAKLQALRNGEIATTRLEPEPAPAPEAAAPEAASASAEAVEEAKSEAAPSASA